MDRIVLRRDTYFDSVFLMSISAELGKVQGLAIGQVVLATPANQQLLKAQGFDLASLGAIGPTDLVISLRAESADALDSGESRLAELLSHKQKASEGQGAHRPVGLDGALRSETGCNLALISVPGDYAAFEAKKALNAGLHVMIFSDNVPVEEEIDLKKMAVSRGLLLMGPDCGTAIINGVMLGFANKIRKGPIGIIGASGTGIQEVTCLIDRLGGGISQAIGTGGRDLSEKVGALTALSAIEALAKDPETKVIVVISKPPAEKIANQVLARLESIDKPCVVHFVGNQKSSTKKNIHLTTDLATTARVACELAEGRSASAEAIVIIDEQLLAREKAGKSKEQKFIRGLFTGGTMGAEALAYFTPRLDKVKSNLRHDGSHSCTDKWQHCVVDLGDDEFTRGRPHPMIDPTPRAELLMNEANDPTISVILLDVLLGTGSHPDPAGALIPALQHAQKAAQDRGGHLSVVASITGTAGDSQGLDSQIAKLKQIGAVILPSNIEAVRFAHAIIAEKANV